jgi:hypothetical protein
MKTDNWTGSATWQSKVLSQRSSSKRFPRPSHSPIVKSAKLLVTIIGGILAMGVAVALGVIASLRIGVGKDIRYRPSFKWWVVNRLAFLVGSTNVATFLVFFLQERFPQFAGEKAAAPAFAYRAFAGLFLFPSICGRKSGCTGGNHHHVCGGVYPDYGFTERFSGRPLW